MRLKVTAGNLVAVILLGFLSYWIVSSQLRAQLGDEVAARIGNDQTLFDRSWRLSGLEFQSFVQEWASSRGMRDVFSALDETSRRQRAYDEAQRAAAWFGNPARGRGAAPDILAIIDDSGKVVARNADKNRMYGVALGRDFPTVRRVLSDGTPQLDVWIEPDEKKVLHTAIAPIQAETGNVIGALLVGYDISNGLARSEAQVLGRDVAFLVNGGVYSSSLDAKMVEPLQNYLFGPLKNKIQQTARSAEGTTERWQTSLLDTEFVGVAAPLPMSPSVDIAYAVLGNRTERMQVAGTASWILVMMGLLALAVLVYGWVIGGNLERPVEQMEQDLLAIINGRTDLRIDLESAEYGGLAYRINQLVNVFTGVAEDAASEDEDGGAAGSDDSWQAGGSSAANVAPEVPAASAPASGGDGGDAVDDQALAARLAEEPEGNYHSRVYREYVEAKRQAGEDLSNIDQERFVQRLRGNEAALAKKHECRMVRFQVQTRGNQVILRPVIIR